MPVDGIKADVDFAIWEPSVEILVALVNGFGEKLVPVDALGLHVEELELVVYAVFVDGSVTNVFEVVC